MTVPRRYVRRVVSKLAARVGESATIEYGSRANSAQSVDRILRPLLESEPVEVFCALLLDGRHRVMGYVEVSRGTLASSIVHPRDVFGPAVRLGTTAAIIVAHNHPSGDPHPSQEDRAVTVRLRDAGVLLGIPVLDHVILGSTGRWVSLRAEGIIG